MADYLYHHNANTHWAYPTSEETDLAIDESPRRCPLGPPGTPVEVVEGPLLGVRGELVRAGARCSLVVRVHFLGFAAEVTIHEAHVRSLR